jgi:hypothetical protein
LYHVFLGVLKKICRSERRGVNFSFPVFDDDGYRTSQSQYIPDRDYDAINAKTIEMLAHRSDTDQKRIN